MKSLGVWLVRHIFSPFIVFLAEKVFRWRMPNRFPDLPKYMFIAEYHTSNVDVLLMMYAMAKEGRRLRFIIKQEVERWPLVGRFLRWTGAIFIDRSSPLSAIKTIMKTVRGAEECVLLICPSGTREYTEGWQPGFYYLANKLDLPMVCGAPDFGAKAVWVGDPIYPSGNIEADIEKMADFFAPVQALHPDRATPVRLLPEENARAMVL